MIGQENLGIKVSTDSVYRSYITIFLKQKRITVINDRLEYFDHSIMSDTFSCCTIFACRKIIHFSGEKESLQEEIEFSTNPLDYGL